MSRPELIAERICWAKEVLVPWAPPERDGATAGPRRGEPGGRGAVPPRGGGTLSLVRVAKYQMTAIRATMPKKSIVSLNYFHIRQSRSLRLGPAAINRYSLQLDF